MMLRCNSAWDCIDLRCHKKSCVCIYIYILNRYIIHYKNYKCVCILLLLSLSLSLSLSLLLLLLLGFITTINIIIIIIIIKLHIYILYTQTNTHTHKHTSGGDPTILSTSDPRCLAKTKTSFGTLHLQNSRNICDHPLHHKGDIPSGNS